MVAINNQGGFFIEQVYVHEASPEESLKLLVVIKRIRNNRVRN
jgi:hypothetical protein